MERVTSKISLSGFNLLFLLLFAAGTGGGVGLIIVAIIEKSKPSYTGIKQDIMIVLGIACITYTIFLIRQYLKNVYKVVVDGNTIRFNNHRYLLKEIKNIQYTGKYKFEGMGMYPEGMKITFKNGETRHIFDIFYSNAHILKQYIAFRFSDKKNFEPEAIGRVTTYIEEHFYKFTGSLLLSMRGISIMIILLIPVFAEKTVNSPENWKFYSVAFIVILLLSFQFNYFELNSGYFRIRNQIRFWKNKTYLIKDIKEIVLESNGKGPHNLRLILNDYKSKTFYASSLNDSKWKELQKEFRKLNIIVRNEI